MESSAGEAYGAVAEHEPTGGRPRSRQSRCAAFITDKERVTALVLEDPQRAIGVGGRKAVRQNGQYFVAPGNFECSPCAGKRANMASTAQGCDFIAKARSLTK